MSDDTQAGERGKPVVVIQNWGGHEVVVGHDGVAWKRTWGADGVVTTTVHDASEVAESLGEASPLLRSIMMGEVP